MHLWSLWSDWPVVYIYLLVMFMMSRFLVLKQSGYEDLVWGFLKKNLTCTYEKLPKVQWKLQKTSHCEILRCNCVQIQHLSLTNFESRTSQPLKNKFHIRLFSDFVLNRKKSTGCHTLKATWNKKNYTFL